MEDFPLNQLRVFYAVARHRSCSRAGQELALSQPAVFRQVISVFANIKVDQFGP
jgi:DNA-binding transcriptional LysR family regulator